MKAKQILDGLSETVMEDERVLRSRERELLISILRTSKTVCSSSPETQSAVAAAIAQSVGETVAQRAFALLGGSIVQQILAGAGASVAEEISPTKIVQFGVPQPPGTAVPIPPTAPKGVPQPPGTTVPQPPIAPMIVPQPPSGPRGMKPQTVALHQEAQRLDLSSNVGVLESPTTERQASIILDEFLAPHELDELIAYTLQHENDFQN